MTYNCQFFVNADSDAGRDDLRVKKLADLPCEFIFAATVHVSRLCNNHTIIVLTCLFNKNVH